ncbi:helix-turn-helix transcriptional regulator [Kitasatospora sp. NPDC004723]|uniref:helix-turn-helix domain-containing protein n=1 Tax=Kitasatospora sp. NPDC004723 TaxID=3154288 RepID=UPI0033AD00C5
MNWNSAAVRQASRTGNYGKVVELARSHRRMTQMQLGAACGLSQSAVSRLEKRGDGPYSMDVLLRISRHLDIPPAMLGLAAAPMGTMKGGECVERRQFLGAAAAIAVAAPALTLVDHPVEEAEPQAAALRLATTSYRRLDGSTPSRELAEATHSHLRLIQGLMRTAPTETERSGLAAAASEAASLAAWLAWDMADHGSARAFYGAAIKAARSSMNPLLAAYQTGSLAQFEAHTGNAVQALSLARSARRFLEPDSPPIADAWLSSVEALGHAAARDRRGADRALTRSRAVIEGSAGEARPPWPWVFTFDESKIAAVRVSCGAKLGLAAWTSEGVRSPAVTGHAKQRALMFMDVATGHLAAGRVEAAFTLAGQALEIGLQYRSGRIVERGRALRRSFSTSSPSRAVRDFDERLHGVHL